MKAEIVGKKKGTPAPVDGNAVALREIARATQAATQRAEKVVTVSTGIMKEVLQALKAFSLKSPEASGKLDRPDSPRAEKISATRTGEGKWEFIVTKWKEQ